jgi:hypothetical protein
MSHFARSLRDEPYVPSQLTRLQGRKRAARMHPAIPAATFRADLLAHPTKLNPFPSSATFYPDTTTHTFIAFDEFYTTTAGGVRLVDWFTKIVNAKSAGHAWRKPLRWGVPAPGSAHMRGKLRDVDSRFAKTAAASGNSRGSVQFAG